MDGILPPQATPNAQLQLQQSGLEAQNFTANQQAKLPIGTVMMAQVLGNDKNGNLLVRINGSDLVLSSPLALAKGAQLQIRLDSISGSVTAELLSVDGKLPAARPQSNDFLSQKGTTDSGLTNTMRLLRALPEGSAKIAPQQTYNTQAALKIDTVSISSTSTSSYKALVVQPTPQIMQFIRADLTDSNEVKSELIKTLPVELKSGAEVNVKINQLVVSPKNSALQPVLPNLTSDQQKVSAENKTLKGQDWMKQSFPPVSELMKNFSGDSKLLPNGNLSVNALVLDSSTSGELLVESKLGLLRINGSTNFTKGTELILEILGFKPAPQKIDSENELPQLGKEWAHLKTAVADNPKEADKIAGSEHNFAAKLTRFVQAIANQDPESWLGAEFLDKMDAKSRDALINQLKTDFGHLRNLATSDPQTNWQTLLFPVFDGKELHQARLHIKNFKNPNSSTDTAGTRFIVELETSFYGEMQFDGLIRKTLPHKHFDLIIRTHNQIDDETKHGISEIFITAQQLSGFVGNIEFSRHNSFPIEIWKDLLDKHSAHDSYIS